MIGILGFLTWRQYKKAQTIEGYDYVLLMLDLPRHNDRSEKSAEQMFIALHSILRDRHELRASNGIQEYLSFEMASVEGKINFFIRTPKHLQNFVETQIMAQYPAVKIHETTDYAKTSNFPASAVAEFALTDEEYIPIKTYNASEIDALTAIVAAMTVNQESDTRVQILARPISDSWHGTVTKYIERAKSGLGVKKPMDFMWFVEALAALWRPPTVKDTTKVVTLSESEQTRVDGAMRKMQINAFRVKIRVIGSGVNQESAHSRIYAVLNAFKQLYAANLNNFRVVKKPSSNHEELQKYVSRYFADNDGFILNAEELATIFHLPIGQIQEEIAPADPEKIVETDVMLPLLNGDPEHDRLISAFGLTNINGLDRQFGMYRVDRSRHVYIIGQTGTGKTALLELLALSDIYHNQGYAIIDPHGDFATSNLQFVPPNRIQDVVYFNPADTAFPLGFNPMEVYDPSQRNNISSEIIGVLKRMFGQSWGPRLEYILRYTILALLEYPNTTLLDITRMLTDKKFRDKVLMRVTDIVVQQFWRVEFGSWGEKETNLAVAPILNKVGTFVANPIIRNIIGQPKSTFNVREIMDQGKILVVNLSKGLIGEDNSAILGALLITKIQLAAISRSDTPEEQRKPFFLYVDEFQNFATDSFAIILSEARKYGLNLVVANQYISQMSDTIRNAVFGNVGTIISMRVSPEDAALLTPQFAPYFDVSDIMSMSNRQFIVRMIVGGQIIPPVMAITLKLPPSQVDYLSHIIENTRQNFAKAREIVERNIAQTMRIPQVIIPKFNPVSSEVVGSQALGEIFPKAAEAPVVPTVPTVDRDDITKRTRTRGRRHKNPVDPPNIPPPPTFVVNH